MAVRMLLQQMGMLQWVMRSLLARLQYHSQDNVATQPLPFIIPLPFIPQVATALLLGPTAVAVTVAVTAGVVTEVAVT